MGGANHAQCAGRHQSANSQLGPQAETSTAEGFYSVPKGVMEGCRLRDREFGSFSVGLIT